MGDITVTDTGHSSHLVDELVTMRNNGEMFDYVIKGTKESFSIHSLVLALTINKDGYFRSDLLRAVFLHELITLQITHTLVHYVWPKVNTLCYIHDISLLQDGSKLLNKSQ